VDVSAAQRWVLVGVVCVVGLGGAVFVLGRPSVAPEEAAAPRVLPSGVEVSAMPAAVAPEPRPPVSRLRVFVVRGRTRVSQQRIQGYLKQARAAPGRFAELCKAHSEDPVTRAAGGLVGEVDFESPGGAAGLSGETFATIAQLEAGTIGGPYPGARGLYLVQVEAVLVARPADGGVLPAAQR
jgi:hypothetical protein